MEKISLKELKVGMVIAQDVVGKDRRLLLTTGAMLTQRHIRAMKIWGITHICVKTKDELLEAQRLSARKSVPPKPIQDRFKLASIDHPLMKELFIRAVRRYEE